MVWTARIRHVLFGAALSAFFVATAAAAPVGGDASFSMAAEKAVSTIEREDSFSGVILVARGDKVLLRKAAGFADRERNIPNTPEMKFGLESVGKQFTATAIMLLVQDGKLSLTDRISKYYAASPPAWRDVTIKHLLTHGSGIEDYWVHRPEVRQALDTGQLFQSYQELIQLAVGDPLAFEPGTNIEYSNTGYALLTAVIERISGQSYADFMHSRIFTPLGMRDTVYGAIPGDAVQGYSRSSDGEWHRGPFVNPSIFGGAGSLSSTLDDMLIWSRAQEGDKILSPTSRSAMFTDYGFNYGFGWRFAPKFGKKLIWHTGSDNVGHASIFDRFPEEGLTVVIMTNNLGLTSSTATLLIEGKETTFPATPARKLVEQVERLYFGRAP